MQDFGKKLVFENIGPGYKNFCPGIYIKYRHRVHHGARVVGRENDRLINRDFFYAVVFSFAV
jgi:hypothetical protein